MRQTSYVLKDPYANAFYDPSDDATVFSFLIPSNFFAVVSLTQAAEMMETIAGDTDTATELRALSEEVSAAIKEHAIIEHETYGPMSITMYGLTSTDDEDIRQCIQPLKATHGDTGFMHESFNEDDPKDFACKWFAWANTLFGEFLWKT